ncbi:MAG: hypothetical protein ONB44_21770 [candidate division KSB1 bacterium]|nr:hypothetical protein [candidate division KSB1 bacterium]
MKKQKEFEDLLLRLTKISPRKSFNSEEVLQILTRYGEPPNWAKKTDEKLLAKINEAKTRRLAKAKANFCNPAQMHSLSELLDSTLIIKKMFISQLAHELDMTAEEIEDCIENRPPAQILREDQMQKLTELTGIALEEIRRIAAETAEAAEMKTHAASETTQKPPRRPYPLPSAHSTVGIIRDGESTNKGLKK